jgi:hypothetical protein
VVIYFKSRYLSECLGIGLAKWKRWVREFLPPDPLSGMQSGYARNLNLKDAFHVYLAGYLVSNMRFSIAQVRQIMSDMEPSLKQQGFQAFHETQMPDPTISFWILIYQSRESGFGYIEVLCNGGSAPEKTADASQIQRTYPDHPIADLFTHHHFVDARIISISGIYKQFIGRIESVQKGI